VCFQGYSEVSIQFCKPATGQYDIGITLRHIFWRYIVWVIPRLLGILVISCGLSYCLNLFVSYHSYSPYMIVFLFHSTLYDICRWNSIHRQSVKQKSPGRMDTGVYITDVWFGSHLLKISENTAASWTSFMITICLCICAFLCLKF